MNPLKEKIQEVSKEIATEILKGKEIADVARITQDEIDVILFPNTQAIEDEVDSIVSGAISEALKKACVSAEGNWWA